MFKLQNYILYFRFVWSFLRNDLWTVCLYLMRTLPMWMQITTGCWWMTWDWVGLVSFISFSILLWRPELNYGSTFMLLNCPHIMPSGRTHLKVKKKISKEMTTDYNTCTSFVTKTVANSFECISSNRVMCIIISWLNKGNIFSLFRKILQTRT